MCDPLGKRPVVTLRTDEVSKAAREVAAFGVGGVVLAIVAVIIYLASHRAVAAGAAGGAAAVSLLAAWWAKQSVRRRLRPSWRWEAARAARGLPLSFGRGCGWLAIRGASPADVIAALSLEATQPADWRRGVRAAYEGKAFVTPPIEGWVLVASARLPDAGDGRTREPLTPFLTDLSRRLDATVLAFASNPHVGYTHLAWAESGTLRRARADVTEPRRQLLDRGERELDRLPPRQPPSEEDLFRIAARWSVDPNAFDDQPTPVGDGWLGGLRLPPRAATPPADDAPSS